MIPSIPQQNNTTSTPAASSVAGPVFKKLTHALTGRILNYIPIKEIEQDVHLVARSCRQLQGSEAHLNLQYSTTTDADLARIAEKYKNSGKSIFLDLSHTEITDAGLAHLADLPLTQLNLNGCKKIKGAGLAYLPHSLTQLDLSYCHEITVDSLAHLAKLRNLTQLNLSGSKKITDADLANLTDLPLTQLKLSSCINITDVGLTHLTDLPLKQLDLSGCKEITNEGLTFLPHSLTQLDLSFCHRITENTNEGRLAHLATLPLTQLSLRQCDICNDDLQHFSKLHLIDLNLAGSAIGDDNLALLPRSLRKLDLGSSYITDNGLALLPLSLTQLSIRRCNITDVGLKHLAKLPLTQLDCISCPKITEGRAWRIWNSSPFNLT